MAAVMAKSAQQANTGMAFAKIVIRTYHSGTSRHGGAPVGQPVSRQHCRRHGRAGNYDSTSV
jgi:hypothetical protein